MYNCHTITLTILTTWFGDHRLATWMFACLIHDETLTCWLLNLVAQFTYTCRLMWSNVHNLYYTCWFAHISLYMLVCTHKLVCEFASALFHKLICTVMSWLMSGFVLTSTMHLSISYYWVDKLKLLLYTYLCHNCDEVGCHFRQCLKSTWGKLLNITSLCNNFV
jgi:hypothetical protein